MSKKQRKTNSNNDNLGTKKTQFVSKKPNNASGTRRRFRHARALRQAPAPLIILEEDPVMGVRSISIRQPKNYKK